jgi:hypothetical protein
MEAPETAEMATVPEAITIGTNEAIVDVNERSSTMCPGVKSETENRNI